MTHLYDDDFYAWTQQQAAAVRASNYARLCPLPSSPNLAYPGDAKPHPTSGVFT
jgi:hypothetical protein